MMPGKVAVLTTFSADGWRQYASRMVRTWKENWPQEVDLWLYMDEPLPVGSASNVYPYHGGIPEKTAFLDRMGDRPEYRGLIGGLPYNYRFDAIRFCHKPFALWHFARNFAGEEYDRLIWLDADTLTHAKVPMAVVDRMAPENADIQFLGRSYKYTECGYLYFNLRKAAARELLTRWAAFYTKRTLVREKEWHDSWLYDQARRSLPNLTGVDLTGHLPRRGGAGHPFINSFLGQYLDHLKGDTRKATGKPKKNDLFAPHDAPYWKDNPHAKAR